MRGTHEERVTARGKSEGVYDDAPPPAVPITTPTAEPASVNLSSPSWRRVVRLRVWSVSGRIHRDFGS